jgi:hypothetical protein
MGWQVTAVDEESGSRAGIDKSNIGADVRRNSLHLDERTFERFRKAHPNTHLVPLHEGGE